jgi:hypothetical protein
VPYAFAVTARGDSPLIVSVTGLPAGLVFNASTGIVSGVPTAGGTSTVTVTASNGCQSTAVQTRTLTVVKASLTISLSASPNPAYFGQPVTVVARVVSAAAFPAQGTVLLCAREESAYCPPPFDTAPPGTPATLIRTPVSAPLDVKGEAVFVLNGLKIDNYVLKATYSGDAGHEAVSAEPIDEFVIKGILLPPPKVAMAGALHATSGKQPSVGVSVTPTTPGPTPTGSVRLYASGQLIGTATLDADAAAQFTIAAASTNALALRADYSGDAVYPAASSPEGAVIAALNGNAEIPAVGPIGLGLLALALAALAMRPLYRRERRP